MLRRHLLLLPALLGGGLPARTQELTWVAGDLPPFALAGAERAAGFCA